MNLLQFEGEFARLKSQLGARPDGDIALLALIDFWPRVQPFLDKRTFDTYVEEYITLLLDRCRPRGLPDLNPDELDAISRCLSETQATSDRFGLDREITAAVTAVRTEWGTKLLYAGDLSGSIAAFPSNGAVVPHELLAATKQIPAGADELDALRFVVASTAGLDHLTTARLRSFLFEWELLRESTSRDTAHGLFVEKSAPGAGVRGRLRELTCTAEYQPRDSESHEVTFEHQIKAPDDPFVGVIYNALDAVHTYLKRPGMVQPRGDHIHAHFQIRASNHTFTGDSIGLAAALAVYAQLLKHEILRHERCIASGAAFTGGVDRDGRVLPVSDESLPTKVTRAFFSPSELLVLPADNLPRAHEVLTPLLERYPRRCLQLVPARHVSEVIGNRNVVRSEKVCAGQYVVRKVYRIGRLTRIQVPLLILLLYALTCLIYPPAWIGFDRNPAFVWVSDAGDRIIVCNQDSTQLWTQDLECVPAIEYRAIAHDLDGDGKREVLYLSGGSEATPCAPGVQLYIHESNGDLRLALPAEIVGEYPGDTVPDQHYAPRDLQVIEQGKERYIVTSILANYPARSHLVVWNTAGERVGWYIHAGHMRVLYAMDITGDGNLELLGMAVNNRSKGLGAFVLPLLGGYGVSPPYTDPEYELTGVKRGNQLLYVLFPTSDLAKAETRPYELMARAAQSEPGSLRLYVGNDALSFRLYYLDSTLRVTRVALSDSYSTQRQAFIAAGRLPAIDTDRYLQMQLDEVTYWTPDGWRTHAELHR